MIRRRGHYIQESKSKLDRNSVAWCLKCSISFCTPGQGAAQAHVFDGRCRGTWKKELAAIGRDFDQAERRQRIALKWLAFDQKLKKGDRAPSGPRFPGVSS